jgi:hypothetical protein
MEQSCGSSSRVLALQAPAFKCEAEFKTQFHKKEIKVEDSSERYIGN